MGGAARKKPTGLLSAANVLLSELRKEGEQGASLSRDTPLLSLRLNPMGPRYSLMHTLRSSV